MVVGDLEHVNLRVVVQDLLGGIGAVLFVELGVQAHVGGDHDEVGLCADLRDGGLHGGAGGLIGAAVDALLAAVPDGHVGGDHADDGHLHAVLLHDGPARAGDQLAVGPLHVGGQHGELGLADDLLHGGDAPVEFVVAQRHGIVAHVIHGGDDGMGLVRSLVVDVVGHNGALDVVARVDEDGVGILGAHLLDVGVEAGHAVVGALLVVLIAVAPDVAMHIRGAQNGDVLAALGGQSRRNEGDQQSHGHQDSQQGLRQTFLLHSFLSYRFLDLPGIFLLYRPALGKTRAGREVAPIKFV